MNKLLTTALSGSQTTGQNGAQGAPPPDRGGRAGLEDILAYNAVVLGTGALAGGLASALLTSKRARKLASGALHCGTRSEDR